MLKGVGIKRVSLSFFFMEGQEEGVRATIVNSSILKNIIYFYLISVVQVDLHLTVP